MPGLDLDIAYHLAGAAVLLVLAAYAVVGAAVWAWAVVVK